jgi:hypothetical protein
LKIFEGYENHEEYSRIYEDNADYGKKNQISFFEFLDNN